MYMGINWLLVLFFKKNQKVLKRLVTGKEFGSENCKDQKEPTAMSYTLATSSNYPYVLFSILERKAKIRKKSYSRNKVLRSKIIYPIWLLQTLPINQIFHFFLLYWIVRFRLSVFFFEKNSEFLVFCKILSETSKNFSTGMLLFCNLN